MVMMFVGGVVLMFDGFLVLFLPLIIYGAGVFCSRPNPREVKLLKDVERVEEPLHFKILLR